MTPYIKYPLVLAIVAALSGAALYSTYAATKGEIEAQKEKARIKALSKVFLSGYGATEDVADDKGKILYTKVWKTEEKQGEPDCFAVEGAAFGYNGGVPIVLLAGFTNPEKDEAATDRILVGWSVTGSEETPGLGEKIKSSAAPYTLVGKIFGSDAESREPKDLRTDFQKQFYNPEQNRTYSADKLALSRDGGPIDAITGATYTSRGVVNAIKDADANLAAALQK